MLATSNRPKALVGIRHLLYRLHLERTSSKYYTPLGSGLSGAPYAGF